MKEKQRRKKAAALTYDAAEQTAPRLVAKGSGEIAEQIITLAKTNHIPVQEDATLVQLLGELDINTTIPEDLYQAVAEIFAFIYRLDKEIE